MNIYFDVNDDRNTKHSFGCNEYVNVKVLVGAGPKNSLEIGQIQVRKIEKSKDCFRYEFKTTGMKTILYEKKIKAFTTEEDK